MTHTQPTNQPTKSRGSNKIKTVKEIFSYKNLLKCYYECRSGKRYTINAAKFEEHFEEELLKLQKELVEHSYKPGQSICFVVTKPKIREIFAADFRDRIVHHVLVGFLEPIFESKFINQSYACRKGKGAHKAIEDLERYVNKVTKRNTDEAWYLQMDIQSFFVSLNKDVLFEILKKRVKNPEILWLAKTIIFHNPANNFHKKGQLALFDLVPENKSLFKTAPNQGLPIGNLTSQFFANVYLNELDQFVKHILKIKCYMRYVDDIVVVFKNKDQLIIWCDEINRFLQKKLKLKLHPQKQVLQKTKNGIDFVGFVVKPSYILIRRRVVRSLKDRLWSLNQAKNKIENEEMPKILSTINSYYGQFKHGKSFGLRAKLWKENFGKLQDFLEPVDTNFSHFNIRENFLSRRKTRYAKLEDRYQYLFGFSDGAGVCKSNLDGLLAKRA